MNNTALVTIPSSDRTTRYISAWAEDTIDRLKSKKLQFVVLSKERANASVLESMIKKHNPSLLFLNGHGGPTLVCGHNDNILIEAGKTSRFLKEL